MARTKKKGVDYFPIQCAQDKTEYIMEQKFGNDGFTFLYKLKRFLGTIEGHLLDTRNSEDMEFLCAQCRLEEITVTEMLNKLASVGAIDKELWSEKLVWFQEFVDDISGVYIKRGTDIPHKPNFCSRNAASDELPAHPDSESTQSIVKDSKVEESIVAPNGAPHKPAGKLKVVETDQRPLQAEYQSLVDEVQKMADDKDRKQRLAEFIVHNRPLFHEPYVDLWNLSTIANGLSQIIKFPPSRLKKFNTRIREPDFDFIGILSEIRKSQFLQGKSGNKDRQWKADWDWVFENDTNYLQILEGKFK